VNPDGDFDAAQAETCLILDVTGLDVPGADDAGLAGALPDPHSVWRKREHAERKSVANGAEERLGAITTFGYAREAHDHWVNQPLVPMRRRVSEFAPCAISQPGCTVAATFCN